MSRHSKKQNRENAGPGPVWTRWGVAVLLAAGAAAVLAIALRGDDATAEVARTPLAEPVTAPAAEEPVPPAPGDPPPGVSMPGMPDNRPKEVFVEGKNGLPDFTYRLPQPGDADYDDYQEMIRHPEYARFNHDRTLPMYYDPEWRAQVNGRREAEVNGLTLLGGATSVDELLRFLLEALTNEDGDGVDELRVTRDEFQLLCWPEFPQSRPYLKIPPDEAWTFHFANMRKGGQKALLDLAGKPLGLVSFEIGSSRDFTNFRLLENVTMTVLDADTGEEMRLETVEAILACRGKYKVFMYRE